MASRWLRWAFPVLSLPMLGGCGGGPGGVSPATNFSDCLSVGGTIYTVDGAVGPDNGTYPCSDPFYRNRDRAAFTSKPSASVR